MTAALASRRLMKTPITIAPRNTAPTVFSASLAGIVCTSGCSTFPQAFSTSSHPRAAPLTACIDAIRMPHAAARRLDQARQYLQRDGLA
jgi:hypothetical protein